MAGVNGRSGGSRPGAGRPPKEPDVIALNVIYEEPDKFLKAVMNDAGTDAKLRVDAAKALLSARVRLAEGAGKKEAKKSAAEKVSGGRFAAGKPPLRVVGAK